MTNETIKIIFEVVDKNLKPALDKLKNSVQNVNKKVNKLNKRFKKSGDNTKFLGIQMIGVVFFARILAGALFGLLQPASESFGMFQLWNDLLTIFFLPIMAALMPYFIDLFNFLTNLPEPVQKAIGLFVFLGGVFFTLIGTLALFIGLLSKLGLDTKIIGTGIKSVFTGLKLTSGLVFLAIAAFIISFVDAWKKNFGGIQKVVKDTFEAIKQTIKGVFEVVSGIVDIFVGLFTGDTDRIKEGFMKVGTGLYNFIDGIIKTMQGINKTIILTIVNAFVNVWNVLKKFDKDIKTWALKTAKNMMDKFVSGIKDKNSAIFNALKSAFGQFWNFLTGKGNSDESDSGGKVKTNDFILSGNRLIQPSPNDTIVGFKNNNKGAGLGGGEVIINQTINAQVTDMKMFERMMQDNNRKLVDDVRRLAKI